MSNKQTCWLCATILYSAGMIKGEIMGVLCMLLAVGLLIGTAHTKP